MLIFHNWESPEQEPLSWAIVSISSLNLSVWNFLDWLNWYGGKTFPKYGQCLLVAALTRKDTEEWRLFGFCSHGLPFHNWVNFCCWCYCWFLCWYYNQFFWSSTMDWRPMALQKPSRHLVSDWDYCSTQPCGLSNYTVSSAFPCDSYCWTVTSDTYIFKDWAITGFLASRVWVTGIAGQFLPCYVNWLDQLFVYVSMHIYMHVHVCFIGSILLERPD